MSVFRDFPGLENLEKNSRTFKDPQESCCQHLDVTLQLIQSQCMPALLYGLEACHLNKADLNSLDLVVNR